MGCNLNKGSGWKGKKKIRLEVLTHSNNYEIQGENKQNLEVLKT